MPVLSSAPSAVPLALQCPGGSDAWQNVTVDGSSRLCQGQRNPCNSSVELGMVGALTLPVGAWGWQWGLALAPEPLMCPTSLAMPRKCCVCP